MSPRPGDEAAARREALAGDLARLAAERSEALVRRDVAAMERLLAPDFTYTNAAGEGMDRATYLDRYLRDPGVRWERQALEGIEVRPVDGAAVLTCRVHDVADFGGTRLDARFRSTFRLARDASGWRFVAGRTEPA